MKNKPEWLNQKTGLQFYQIPVTRLLNGELNLGLHAMVGAAEGPTLGMVGGIHGDEILPPMVYKALLEELDPAKLAGRLVIIPVANPAALGVFDRQTPEQHGNTDLHTVFPGNLEKGNLTNKLAISLQENLMDHLDAFVDFHSGGSGGRLQNRSDYEGSTPDDLQGKCLAMCRAFGAPFIHKNSLAKTATSYVNAKGIPTCNAEAGGAYLGPEDTKGYMQSMTWGLRNLMRHLGMLPDEVEEKASGQLLFGGKDRVEVNPSVGGYLQSRFDRPGDLGRLVEEGEILGEIVDMHSLKVSEVMRAACRGFLFFSRYSGAVDAGTKAFALARESGVERLD